MSLADAAAVMHATPHDAGEGSVFRGISTDSRSASAGALFFALEGPNFDGHDYVASAVERGVAAAVVARRVDSALAQLQVDDTLTSLGALAKAWRDKSSARVAAVTGSNGKTSVKEMLAGIAAQAGSTLATRGNLNNEIGLPLTLAELDASHDFAVLEMGASAPGEVARLVAIGQPAIAIITLCAPAHIEGFGSIEAVARAKGEIIEGLPADGIAVINADDNYAPLWRQLAGGRRVVGFGSGSNADTRVSVSVDGLESDLTLSLLDGLTVSARLRLPGEHAARNALAAATAAQLLGIDAEAIRLGIEAALPVRGRLRPVRLAHGHLLLDDSYNANPHSLRAGFEVLARAGMPTIAALGDMAELGPTAAQDHFDSGEAARALGIGALLAAGPLGANTVRGFGAGARHFDTRDALVDALEAKLQDASQPHAVLVKGSLSSGMGAVVDALEERFLCS